MVRIRAIHSSPPATLTMTLVNLSPRPETNTQPMMMPAVAQATDTLTAWRAPSSRAENISAGLMRVSLRRELSTRMEMMAQKAANMGV